MIDDRQTDKYNKYYNYIEIIYILGMGYVYISM